MNYAKQLPLDKNNYPYPAPPAFVSNQSQAGNPIASSVITLSANTTVISLMAIGGNAGNAGLLGKWVTAAQITSGASSVTSTNFDIMVNSGQTLSFVVPISTNGTGTQSVQGINPTLGLYPALSVKAATAQACSVFSAEY